MLELAARRGVVGDALVLRQPQVLPPPPLPRAQERPCKQSAAFIPSAPHPQLLVVDVLPLHTDLLQQGKAAQRRREAADQLAVLASDLAERPASGGRRSHHSRQAADAGGHPAPHAPPKRCARLPAQLLLTRSGCGVSSARTVVTMGPPRPHTTIVSPSRSMPAQRRARMQRGGRLGLAKAAWAAHARARLHLHMYNGNHAPPLHAVRMPAQPACSCFHAVHGSGCTESSHSNHKSPTHR